MIIKSTTLIIFLFINFTMAFSEDSESNLSLIITTSVVPNNEEVQSKIIAPFVSFEKHYENKYFINFGLGTSVLMLNRESFGKYSSIDVSNLIAGVGISFEMEDIYLKNQANFSIGLPIAFYKSSNIDDKRLTEFNYISVISAQGWSNPYPWLINTCPFIFTYNGNLELSQYIYIDYTFSPAYLLSMNDRPSGLGLQNIITFSIQSNDFMAKIGFNNYYSTINLENNDHSQSSIIGGISMRSQGFLYDLKFGLNLDVPNGIFYNPPKTNWGISFGLKYFLE